MADKHTNPYCDSVFVDKDELSMHIDKIHYGLELLEGDSKKY